MQLFIYFLFFNLFLVANMYSTSLPGGNKVDCLPPVSNTAVRDIRFEIGPILFEWNDSFALDFKYVAVVRLVNLTTRPVILT
jgi:hypothetical protein